MHSIPTISLKVHCVISDFLCPVSAIYELRLRPWAILTIIFLLVTAILVGIVVPSALKKSNGSPTSEGMSYEDRLAIVQRILSEVPLVDGYVFLPDFFVHVLFINSSRYIGTFYQPTYGKRGGLESFSCLNPKEKKYYSFEFS